MTAPEKLHGEVWRGEIDAQMCAITSHDGDAWPHAWSLSNACWYEPRPLLGHTIMSAGLLAMMAERDAALADISAAIGFADPQSLADVVAHVRGMVEYGQVPVLRRQRDEALTVASELSQWRYDAEHREAEMAASLRGALAEVTRLRGLPPSLPGHGYDEEPEAERKARHDAWYERTGKTIIAKPREP